MAGDPTYIENKVTFRMPEELHLRLKLVAVKERKSVQEILNGLALSYVNRREAEA
jgi:predicted HicB family RNase H-like nuclease